MNSLELIPAFESGMPTATDLIWIMSACLGVLIVLAMVAYVMEVARLLYESDSPLPASEFHGCGMHVRRQAAGTSIRENQERLRPAMNPAGAQARLATGL